MATVEITADNFKETIEKRGIVLLDFWAEWCGPCRAFAPVFEKASDTHTDVVFGKVDTENQQELAGAAGIQAIPTLMLFRDGILLFRESGALPPAALEELVTQAKALDMEKVKKEIAEHEHEHEHKHGPDCDHDHRSRRGRRGSDRGGHVTVCAVRLVALVLLSSTVAHADVRDAFGFTKKKQAEPEASLDCSDGTAFGCVGASDPLDENASPYALSTWLDASYLLSLPVADASYDEVAHYALGAFRDEAGPSFCGASGLENRWLIEGAPVEGIRTGVADTRLPISFLRGMLVTAGGFTARDRVSTGGLIAARLRSGTTAHEINTHAWLGWTAPARQRALAPATYFLRTGKLDVGPQASALVVATGPLGELLGGTAWYAAGLAPELTTTTFTWRAATITDRDNDGVPDGLPGVVVTEPIDSYSRTPLTWRVPLMARAGLDRGVHHADLTLVGVASSDVFYLFNSTLQAAGVDATNVVGDAIATWHGNWTDTRLRGQLAWHRSMRHETARDPQAANEPQLLSAYVPQVLHDDQRLADACSDADPTTDPFPNIPNCPVPRGWFASGGAGRLSDVTGDRPSITADLAHRIGNNVVRVGATGEDTRHVTETHFTGGTQIRSLFPSHLQDRHFLDPNQTCHVDLALSCPTVDTSVLSFRTRYTAAYVEDTWHPDPSIAVDAGLRWELMWVGTVLHFSDQFAPRFGASWDPLGDGRSRVWVSLGRSYALLPAGLGPTIIARERYVDHIVFMGSEARAVETGAALPVAPGIEPIAQDELTTGAQVALARTVRATMWLQGRWLRRGLETTGGVFDNPGRYGGTPALRESGVFAAELATSPDEQLVLRVGYMYGRTVGTWTGAFNPREGVALYAGSDFDAGSVNLLGRLPTDPGHRTYIEAERSGEVGPVKLTLAMRLTAGSGRPRSVIAEADEGVLYLLPRGSAGRGPLLTQANVRLAAVWRGLDITLDLFNVFDRHDATAIDEVYAGGPIHPIDGGTLADLVFLKTDTGSDATRRPSFATATAFQAPLAAFLGVQHTF